MKWEKPFKERDYWVSGEFEISQMKGSRCHCYRNSRFIGKADTPYLAKQLCACHEGLPERGSDITNLLPTKNLDFHGR